VQTQSILSHGEKEELVREFETTERNRSAIVAANATAFYIPRSIA